MPTLADMCAGGYCHHWTGKQGEVFVGLLFIGLLGAFLTWKKHH